jgi:hypothetical protein
MFAWTNGRLHASLQPQPKLLKARLDSSQQTQQTLKEDAFHHAGSLQRGNPSALVKGRWSHALPRTPTPSSSEAGSERVSQRDECR